MAAPVVAAGAYVAMHIRNGSGLLNHSAWYVQQIMLFPHRGSASSWWGTQVIDGAALFVLLGNLVFVSVLDENTWSYFLIADLATVSVLFCESVLQVSVRTYRYSSGKQSVVPHQNRHEAGTLVLLFVDALLMSWCLISTIAKLADSNMGEKLLYRTFVALRFLRLARYSNWRVKVAFFRHVHQLMASIAAIVVILFILAFLLLEHARGDENFSETTPSYGHQLTNVVSTLLRCCLSVKLPNYVLYWHWIASDYDEIFVNAALFAAVNSSHAIPITFALTGDIGAGTVIAAQVSHATAMPMPVSGGPAWLSRGFCGVPSEVSPFWSSNRSSRFRKASSLLPPGCSTAPSSPASGR